jgi:hypothetical protein
MSGKGGPIKVRGVAPTDPLIPADGHRNTRATHDWQISRTFYCPRSNLSLLPVFQDTIVGEAKAERHSFYAAF